MSSIPDNFEVQAAKSNYTRLTVGKHRLRVLGPAISGWLWWTDTPDGGRRPQRVKDTQAPPVEHADDVKKFLTFPVWNYDLEKIQVFEVTQVSIQKELKALDKDRDWGDLQDYDIEVERTGIDKNNTKYRVTPKPKNELSEDVIAEVTDKGLPILEALYKNQDPFNYNAEATYDLEAVDVDKVDKDLSEQEDTLGFKTKKGN